MVYVLLAPGFEESEAIVPTDLLRQGGLETALVSLSGPTVTGGHNITVQADLELSQVDLDQAEMIVLPGGGVGVENLWNSEAVSQLIQELLARWGLLDGRKATSYPTRHDQLGKAEVLPQERAVADGKFVTGHACGSSFDFGLKLVEVLRGKEVADEINGRIFYYR